MQATVPLEYGKYYHIYNCGINGCPIFKERGNYEHFLRLYEWYVTPIAHTYAWCLMGNHLHLLVQIKEEHEIGFLVPNEKNATGASRRWKVVAPESLTTDVSNLKRAVPYRQLSHLFNAYAKAFNHHYNRKGSLFIKNFKRKQVDNEIYFRNLVLYIHNNPVHHGFCSHPVEYPWSSYLTCISDKPTLLKRNEVISWFDDRSNFIATHRQIADTDFIGHLTIE